MTAPPPPGWYPDPDSAQTQRYFDGNEWTDHLAPLNPASTTPSLPPEPQSERPGPAKSPWPFAIMAMAGPVIAVVCFIVMQLAFGAAAAGNGSGTLWFQIAGFASFLLWLVSVGATLVGIIGAVVRSVKR